MTAIAALVDDGKVWMGGDAAGTSGWSLQTRDDPKVFINGEFIIGYTSSFRMGQLLQYCFTPPTPIEGCDGMRYMVTQFIPAVKQCLADGGWKKNEGGRDDGGTFLVGWRGGLYMVDDDFQVARMLHKFAAVGCGQDLALGSLLSTGGKEPEYRVIMALEAAGAFSAGVRGPYTVLSR